MIRSKDIRDSANGENCTLAIVGICCYNTETTVLAHFPDESHGGSRKSDDISAGYACASCHNAVDGIKRAEWREDDWCEFKNHREWYLRRAQTRTLRRLIEKGIVEIAGYQDGASRKQES